MTKDEKKKARAKKYSRMYYLKNKEAIKAYSRKYREDHKEKIEEKRRTLYQTDPEYRKRALSYQAKYRNSAKGKATRKALRKKPDAETKKKLDLEAALLKKQKRHEAYIRRKIRLYGDNSPISMATSA